MAIPDFVHGGTGELTEAGQKLVNWMEATINLYDKPGTDANLGMINRLPTPLQFYWTSVMKMKSQKAYSWLRNFKESAAEAWAEMEALEVFAAKEAQNAETATTAAAANDKVTALEAALAEVKESVATQVAKLEADNASLKAELDALKAKKPVGRPAKKTEVETDAETPAESE